MSFQNSLCKTPISKGLGCLDELYRLDKHNCDDHFWSHCLFSDTATSPVLIEYGDFNANQRNERASGGLLQHILTVREHANLLIFCSAFHSFL